MESAPEVRLSNFLKNQCVVCYGVEELPYPSSELPCCKKRIHEGCLRKWFISGTSNGMTCPHCRGDIVPVNENAMILPYVPERSHVFRFKYIAYSLDTSEEAAYERFMNPSPIPTAPPGWREFGLGDA